MTDFYITCYREYQNNEDQPAGLDGGINATKTNYWRRELKEVNYLINPVEQMRTDWVAAHRPGAVADNALPETTLQLSVGAKLLPTLPMRGRQFIHYLAMALGLESRREGFLNPHSWKHNKMVWGMNLEAYTGTDLDNAGLATRSGESIQVHRGWGLGTTSR